jgi:hypothetical protein
MKAWPSCVANGKAEQPSDKNRKVDPLSEE